ncbi:hypothetical protein SBRCBS47491_009877 [Sporothrix bragantina]|uniref:Uncharacterized protein n=1 Tax=Sporothrix bragantina TaxID=671064 RepID=A0ABP0CYF0_9PEZI
MAAGKALLDEAVVNDVYDEDDTDRQLDDLVLTFLISCIKVLVGGDEFDNVLLCFCAALGIQAEPAGYRPARTYTPMLAGILWWCRAVFLEDAFAAVAGGYKAMAYGKAVRNGELNDESLRWSADSTTLFQYGEGINVHAFQATACRLVDEVQAQAEELLTKYGAGSSFINRALNEIELQPGAAYLLQQSGTKFWDRDGAFQANRAEAWLRVLARFRANLLVALHLRSYDTVSTPRNVFVLDGEVVLINERDKHAAVRGKARRVARFLPNRVGVLLVAYLAWLQPTELFFARLLQRLPAGVDALARVFAAGTGVRLNIRRYRPIAIELGRQIKGIAIRSAEVGENDCDDDEGEGHGDSTSTRQRGFDSVWDLQATHSTSIARYHYAVHVGYAAAV